VPLSSEVVGYLVQALHRTRNSESSKPCPLRSRSSKHSKVRVSQSLVARGTLRYVIVGLVFIGQRIELTERTVGYELHGDRKPLACATVLAMALACKKLANPRVPPV
jgi:hypothetical protein